MIKDGRENDLVPRSYWKYVGGAPCSAYRFNSLASPNVCASFSGLLGCWSVGWWRLFLFGPQRYSVRWDMGWFFLGRHPCFIVVRRWRSICPAARGQATHDTYVGKYTSKCSIRACGISKWLQSFSACKPWACRRKVSPCFQVDLHPRAQIEMCSLVLQFLSGIEGSKLSSGSTLWTHLQSKLLR